MSKNIKQVYDTNPITSNSSGDLMYFGQSPYGTTNDAAMLYSNFAAQFVAAATASTAGKILRSNGSAWVASTSTFADTYTSGTVLAAQTANTITGLAYSSTSAASTLSARDANGNTQTNNFIAGYTTTATAAGTTTLTVSSTYNQYFTGSTTQTVTLPVTSTLVLGQAFSIVNNSSGVVTVQSSGGNTLQAMAANTTLVATCILTSGTGTASWSWNYRITSLSLPLSIANGGTGVSSVTTAPTASAWAGWDANSNLSANNINLGYTTTATAAGTTVLTVGSTYSQYFTGSTTQTITLPVTSTLVLGQAFMFMNNSTGSLTINSSGGNLVTTLTSGSMVIIECILTSGTSAASWNAMPTTYMNQLTFTNQNNLTGTVTGNNLAIAPTGTSATASGFAAWDSNSNLSFNNYINGYLKITSAAGTTTLTVASAGNIVVTGSTTQTIQMPVVSTLVNGMRWFIKNNSTGVVTVNTSGGNQLASLFGSSGGGDWIELYVLDTTAGTGTASWETMVTGVLATNSSVVYRSAAGQAISTSFLGGNYTSSSANPGTSGVIRLASSDSIVWRNNANSANVSFSKNSSDFVSYSGSFSATNVSPSYTTTATAAGTTTLTVSSSQLQYFTGSTTQTVVLPATSTLALGYSFTIVNSSTGVVTVQSSGANNIQAMAANTQLVVTCILTSGTTAASWSWVYQNANNAGVGITTVGNVTSGSVAFDGTAGTTITGTSAGGLSLGITALGSGTAQAVNITGGGTGSTGSAGGVNITGGSSQNGSSGGVVIKSGTVSGTGAGGAISVTAGSGLSGGNLTLASGGGNLNSATGQPGAISITGGTAANGGGGTATNINANNITITNSIGIGTGQVGKIFLQADASGTGSGSTAHTSVNRLIINGSVTGMTSGAASTIATPTIASNSMAGGTIHYTVEASDGTDFQVTSGSMCFSITNKAGTIGGTATVIGSEVTRATTGALSNAFSVTAAGLVQITPTVTTITATTLRITYTLFNHGQQAMSVPS